MEASATVQQYLQHTGNCQESLLEGTVVAESCVFEKTSFHHTKWEGE